jgi:hypothetical protein
VPVTVVLAVGVDSEMLDAESTLWKSKGFFFISVRTVKEAVTRFHAGDFDIILLGDSVSLENRERLTFLIQAAGSQTPVVCIEDQRCECESFADANSEQQLNELVTGIQKLLANKQQPRADRADPFGSRVAGRFPDAN